MKLAISSVVVMGLTKSVLGSTPPAVPPTSIVTSSQAIATPGHPSGTWAPNVTITSSRGQATFVPAPSGYYPCVIPTSYISATYRPSPGGPPTVNVTTYYSTSSATHHNENWGASATLTVVTPSAVPYCPPYNPNGTATAVPVTVMSTSGSVVAPSVAPTTTLSNNTGGDNQTPQNLNNDGDGKTKTDSAVASVSFGISGAALAALVAIMTSL